MIPKIAHFHWEGPMTWMRWATIKTFELHHPDFDIRVVRTPEFIKDKVDTPHHRGDWTVYQTLLQHGGWAIDTDIVFLRRMPDEWVGSSFCTCTAGHPFVYQMAIMGMEPWTKFSRMCNDRARALVGRGDLRYQTLGVALLMDINVPDYNVDQPMDATCPVRWQKAASVWDYDEIELPDDVVGVHWYGGSDASKQHEPNVPFDESRVQPYIVRLAMRSLNGTVSV